MARQSGRFALSQSTQVVGMGGGITERGACLLHPILGALPGVIQNHFAQPAVLVLQHCNLLHRNVGQALIDLFWNVGHCDFVGHLFDHGVILSLHDPRAETVGARDRQFVGVHIFLRGGVLIGA